jgi:hypothetical protein
VVLEIDIWRAANLSPQRYGEKALEASGPGSAPTFGKPSRFELARRGNSGGDPAGTGHVPADEYRDADGCAED